MQVIQAEKMKDLPPTIAMAFRANAGPRWYLKSIIAHILQNQN